MITERQVYTLADLRDWRRATAGLAHPLRLAVFGDPVAHSASPPLHNAALAAMGLPLHYTRVHVAPGQLPEALGLLAAQGFLGVNLTIPHKTAALPLLDVIDPHAVQLGAVNTVRVAADGRLHGFNTDGPGFVQAAREALEFSPAGQRVMILGAAGGAGRALSVQCILEGCAHLVLVNRTAGKAEALAQQLQAKFPARTGSRPGATRLEVIAWENAADAGLLDAVDLVVNTTSLGLKSGDVSPLPAHRLPRNLLVFDTVYRASGEETPLVAAATTAGARATDGRALLLHQGALALRHWFDRDPPLAAMRRALQSPILPA